MTDQQDIVTLAEAARLLGVSKSTASRLYKAGHLRGYKLTPKRNSPLRIYRTSVDELLKRRQQV
jgi:excisionase family DNA binding protein